MPPSKAQRAKTAQRRSQAIALKLAGAEWQQIADTLGYADRGAACKDVTRALEAAIAEGRAGAEILRETELLRLDRLQRGHWSQAVGGDPRAADTVLKVIDRRCRLLGLDVPPDVEEQMRRHVVEQVSAQFFVIMGQVLDGLTLTDGQRGLVPELVQRAVALLDVPSQRRQIEGEVAA
jgi:hypothetical protein